MINLEIEIVHFDTEDVITTSSGVNTCYFNNHPFGELSEKSYLKTDPGTSWNDKIYWGSYLYDTEGQEISERPYEYGDAHYHYVYDLLDNGYFYICENEDHFYQDH